MKKLALVFLLVAALAPPAMAGQIQIGYSGDQGGYGKYQTGRGGEFTYNPINTAGWLDTSSYAATTKNIGAGNTFQTFCVEVGEYIYPYNSTYSAALNQNAVLGGVAGTGGDPISVGTGWLYSQFAEGSLAGYNYSGTEGQREASAALLQNTIWWLEGETHSGGDTNIFGQAVLLHFTTAAAAKADGGWTYGVYAINLWNPNYPNDPSVGRAQDGLFYVVPDGGTTLVLLGGALMGLGALRRKIGR